MLHRAPRSQEALSYPQALTALFMKTSPSDWRQELFAVCVCHSCEKATLQVSEGSVVYFSAESLSDK